MAVGLAAITACSSGKAVVGNPTAPSAPLALTNAFVIQGNTDTGTSVMQFAATSPGNGIPISTLVPPLTMNILSVATDSLGFIYVGTTTAAGGEILVYPVTASGSATPTRTILGGPGSFTYPSLMTIDASGLLYVSDPTYCDCVLVFANNANGMASPLRTIQGNLTQIVNPVAIAVDGPGNLYVADHSGEYPNAPTSEGAQVNVFPPGAAGNLTPAQVITGTTSAPLSPILGMVVDATSHLYVNYGVTLVEYTADSKGSFLATNTIIPPAGETESSTLRLDANENLFVLWLTPSSLLPHIAAYAPTATGLATPLSPFTTPNWTGTPNGEQFALR